MNKFFKTQKRILVMIFMLLLVIIGGTYAWFTYRSNETKMVLTVGDINKLKISLTPYKINTSFAPSLTYEGNEYTMVTAMNNSDATAVFDLYYEINNIDDSLISEDFKYTILRSIDNGNTYEEYLTGNFSTALNNNNLIIFNDESVPLHTTYFYQVFLWIDGSVNDNTSMSGAIFNGQLNAEIKPVEYTFEYTGDYQEFVIPRDGYYFIEAYGAQGGPGRGGNDGAANAISEGFKGSYSAGKIYFNKDEKLYIYVGSKGNGYPVSTTGGYNGGGAGDSSIQYYEGGGGGGASDVRYFENITPTEEDLIWNSDLGLNSRIIVAAGGGGFRGAQSGGLIGHSSYSLQATQNSGYAFGLGASGIAGTTNGGAGGGYYGGNSTTSEYYVGGSSSFISGYAGVNAITSSTNRTHINNTLHYSGKYFIDAKMKEVVNEGNGKVKISYLGKTSPERVNTALDNVRYIKECMNQNSVNAYNIMVEFQAIYEGRNVAKGLTPVLYSSSGTSIAENSSHPYSYITDGDITTSNYSYGTTYNGEQCFVIDLQSEYDLDEVASWGYWGDSRVNYSNVIYVSSDNQTWEEIINNGAKESSNGKRVNAYQTVSTEDTIAPVITVSNNSGTSWTTGSSVITYTVTDAGGSGIDADSIKYGYYSDSISNSLDLSSTTVGNGGIITSGSGSGTWSAARTGSLYIKACDNAGNCTTNSDIYLRIYKCYSVNTGYSYYSCYESPSTSSTKVASIPIYNGSTGYSRLMFARYKDTSYWYSTLYGCYIWGGTPDSSGWLYYYGSSC